MSTTSTSPGLVLKMEDELEDKVLYQTYLSHMKLLSKCAVGLPLNTSPLTYLWRLLRLYILRPEVLILSAILFVMFLYLQTLDVWSRGLFTKLQISLERSLNPKKFLSVATSDGEKLSWELREGSVAAYAVQGRRPRMEDRFVINEDINNTGISLFAVFDGHGGEFAANYARDKLIKNLNTRLVEVKELLKKGPRPTFYEPIQESVKESKEQVDSKPESAEKKEPTSAEKKSNFKKSSSTTEECIKKGSGITDPELLKKLESITRPITREVRKGSITFAPKAVPLQTYIDSSKFSGIDYGKLISDEVLAADHLLVEAAKKSMDVAGTTALIALLEGSHLVVANVGDSRGIMCDSKGNAIPLSFDHKPQQMRERKRIKEAGGFITFNGVWRVAGILATSRALGDYPLKDKKLVIADPDILTFDLSDHKPLFILLASDGLWDTFTNEEAVAFVKERLNEPHFGAKSITLQSYYRGSLDNITVMVINFREKKWSSYSMQKN